MRGLEIDVALTRNILRSSTMTGIFLHNLFTRDAELHVTISNNRIYGNTVGFIAYAGVSADSCDLVVESTNNIDQNNEGGGGLLVGLVDYPYFLPPIGGNDNHLSWTSRGDRIVGNGEAQGQVSGGGILVWGAYLHVSSIAEASRNLAEVSFFDTTFAGTGDRENQASGIGRADVIALGLYGLFTDKVYPDNTAMIQLEGCVSDGTPVYFDHSLPDDPEDTNRVVIVGGSDSVSSNNEGIPGAVEIEYPGI
jgi:hypothetical protein